MSTLKLKRALATGNVPASLDPGEIAINEFDGKLFARNAAGAVVGYDLTDMTADEILASLLTVDTNTSGLNASTLRGTTPGTTGASLLAASTAAAARTIIGAEAGSLAVNGYQRLPGGIILQWGVLAVNDGATITFPLAFPTALYVVVPTASYAAAGTTETTSSFVSAASQTAFTIRTRFVNNGGLVGVTSAYTVNWIAIGR